jgi:LacI family transcriptional regulator
MCSHDRAAVVLIAALKEKGIRCPEDVSVTGFENEFPEGPKSEYELTTIDFAIENQGAEMIRLLAKQFSGDTTHPERVRLPIKLVVRRSACPPRV